MTATVIPMIPEVVRLHFAEIVKGAARDVWGKWRHVFTFQDLHQEAWAIATQRWQLWSDQPGMARKDCRLYLYRWVDSQLPALGFKRMTVEGKRRWVKVSGEIPASHALQGFEPQASRLAMWNPDSDPLGLTLAPFEWNSEASADIAISFGVEWPEMNKSQRNRFARFLMANYPVLVAEFLILDSETRPPRMAQAQWCKRQAKARGSLRVKYATELATARFAMG
jgi:hypothetical protein